MKRHIARNVTLICVVSACAAAVAGGVRMAESEIKLPTYAPGGYDKTPLFYTGRVYQGTSI